MKGRKGDVNEMKSRMNVAVLGGGNGAHAMAADLTRKGYTVKMYEMPEYKTNMQKVFDTKTIEAEGVINGAFKLADVTDDITSAVSDAKYILIITPAYAHRGYGELLKGKLSKDQVVITFPGAFAALIYKKIWGEQADCPVLVDTNDLPYNARLTGPGRVKIFATAHPRIAFMPAGAEAAYMDEIQGMFDVGGVYSDVLECGLAIVNPALHSGPCLLNAGPVEYWTTNFYLYEQGFTPAAAKVDKKLDDERKAVAAKFGYRINPMDCFPNIADNYDYTWQDLYRAAHGDIGLTPICGPNDINSRYFTEDAPCGLVPWSYLGKSAGVETRTIDSIVNIYSVFHERDWWKEGVTIEDLGLFGMSAAEIRDFVRTGKK